MNNISWYNTNNVVQEESYSIEKTSKGIHYERFLIFSFASWDIAGWIAIMVYIKEVGVMNGKFTFRDQR